MSRVFSTLNPRVVDEKCAFSLHYFDLLSEANNDTDISCILGSDTGV